MLVGWFVVKILGRGSASLSLVQQFLMLLLVKAVEESAISEDKSTTECREDPNHNDTYHKENSLKYIILSTATKLYGHVWGTEKQSKYQVGHPIM